MELRLALRIVHRQLHAGLLGEVARDFGKGLALDVHQEREDVARRLAPEAVVEAATRVHVEGRRLFVVKRAKAPEAVAGLLERDVVADDVCDGGAVADLSNLVFGNHRRVSPMCQRSVDFACFLASAARRCSCGAMAHARASLRQILWVYALVCVAVLAVTRLEPIASVGQYVHLVVAAIFLLTAIRLTRGDPAHFGVALGGLLEPATDDRPAGPLGLFDLGRAIRDALPSAAKELGVAIGVAAVVFPLYAVGFYWWNQPPEAFAGAPSHIASFVLAQLIVVALPEEAFFRGYLQTALSDLTKKRLRVLGVELAPGAWVLQAACLPRSTSWSSPTLHASRSFSRRFSSGGPELGAAGSAQPSRSTR